MNNKFFFGIAGYALLLCVNGCATSVQIHQPADNYITTGNKQFLLAKQAPISAENSARGVVIKIDKSVRYQKFIGAGAAITDATAINLNRLDAPSKERVLNELFSRSGLGFSFTRLTIGGSDFSDKHYSFSDKKGEFSLSPIKDTIIPIAKEAKRINPDLTIMATPWSAPSWMKTTDSMIGGTLRRENYDDFADYLLRYTDEMGKAGVKVSMLTIQNEPDFSPPDYPGMKLLPQDRADFLKNHLGPKMGPRKDNPKILEWDHNWDKPEQPLAVLNDDGARKYLTGVAWHCYAGNVATQNEIHNAHPEMETYFTECSGGEWNKSFSDSFVWQMDNLIIGSTNAWAKGVLMWNLALDENYGPHLGGCGNCFGVISINSKTKEITRDSEYYSFGHLSKFVMPGAVRIGSTQDIAGLKNVAFQNPDGSIALLVLNKTDSKQAFSAQIASKYYNAELLPFSAITIIFK